MKFCNLSEKSLVVLKLKPKLNLNIMLKGSKTMKIMKGSKNRSIIKTSKSFIFAYKQARSFDISLH